MFCDFRRLTSARFQYFRGVFGEQLLDIMSLTVRKLTGGHRARFFALIALFYHASMCHSRTSKLLFEHLALVSVGSINFINPGVAVTSHGIDAVCKVCSVLIL